MLKTTHYNPVLACPDVSCRRSSRSKRGIKRGGFYSVGEGQSTRRRQRYQCRDCGRSFSESFYSLDYRYRRYALSEAIFTAFTEGLSNHQIARRLHLAASTVRNRLRRLSQQAILIHSVKCEGSEIRESIAYDGVENFARSQYEPNYINHAIGMDSHFIYDLNFSPLNRKGRMSDRQKRRKVELEACEGRFDPRAVDKSTRTLLSRLRARCPEGRKLLLCSDEHFLYRPAVRALGSRNVEHVTISAKRSRVYRHILFSVNHTDLLLRQYVKAFQRETISFSKKHGAMIHKYFLFLIWKNYMRPKFTKPQRRDSEANKRTPAMYAGVEGAPLTFAAVFSRRWTAEEVSLNSEWMEFLDENPRIERTKVAA